MSTLQNPQWELFAREYLIDLNKTQAAIRAGYSAKTARSKGYDLYHHNAAIKARIGELMQERIDDTTKRRYRVLDGLEAIAYTDRTEITKYTKDGAVITSSDELTQQQRKAISSIKSGQFGDEVKTYDKLRALELLARMLGMFDADGKNEDTNPDRGLTESIELSAKEVWANDIPDVQPQAAESNDVVGAPDDIET